MDHKRCMIKRELAHDGVVFLRISLSYPVFDIPPLDVFEKAVCALDKYAENVVFSRMCAVYDKNHHRRKRLHVRAETVSSDFGISCDDRYLSVMLEFSVCGRAIRRALTFDMRDNMFVSCDELDFHCPVRLPAHKRMFFYTDCRNASENSHAILLAQSAKESRASGRNESRASGRNESRASGRNEKNRKNAAGRAVQGLYKTDKV